MNGPANKVVINRAKTRAESSSIDRVHAFTPIPPPTHLNHAYFRRNNPQSHLIPPNPTKKVAKPSRSQKLPRNVLIHSVIQAFPSTSSCIATIICVLSQPH